MSLVWLAEDGLTFVRQADAARAVAARPAASVDAAAMRHARLLWSASAVCAALSELRWLLQSNVSMTATFRTRHTCRRCRARTAPQMPQMYATRGALTYRTRNPWLITASGPEPV